jgi:thiol-disulfide isomerase/thioredoxin
MTRTFAVWFVAAAAALLAASSGPGAPAARAGEDPVIPNWTLRCVDGTDVDFHEALAEGPVLVSFWALWCKPCLAELPHLDDLARETKGKLTVLAVNMDNPKGVARVRPYIKSKGYEMRIPLDTAGDVGRKLQIGSSVPFLVLYDAAGKEIYKHVGYKEGDERELRGRVSALLGIELGGVKDGGR